MLLHPATRGDVLAVIHATLLERYCLGRVAATYVRLRCAARFHRWRKCRPARFAHSQSRRRSFTDMTAQVEKLRRLSAKTTTTGRRRSLAVLPPGMPGGAAGLPLALAK